MKFTTNPTALFHTKPIRILLFVAAAFLSGKANAQLTLPAGSSYTENFDGMGTAGTTAPTGWTARTSATASSRGSATTLIAAPNVTGTTGAAYNYPYGTGRCIGVRQSGSFGDPGAAFELQISSTTGKTGFSVSLEHLMLNVQTRSTTWSIQYSLNGTSWTTVGTYTDPGVTGSTPATYSLGTGLDNQAAGGFIRIVTLSASTGGGSRDAYGMDNFTLTWTNASSCAVPTGIMKSNIANNGFDLSWTAATGTPSGYEYAVTTSATPPASGTAVAGTSVSVDSLTAGTLYYVYLRTDCGGGSFSNWVSDSVTSLPVTFISFNAQQYAETNVRLSWATAQEVNNSHFEIERSADGKEFVQIGQVKGNGTTNRLSEYHFVDADVLRSGSAFYYRLKQVDFDGNYDFTPVKYVASLQLQNPVGNVSVTPNPVNDQSVIRYTLNTAGNVSVTVYNIVGQPVAVLSDRVQNKGEYELALPHLGDGVYFVRVETGLGSRIVKVYAK